MVEPSGFYTQLASRSGFNASVRHINRTLDLLDSCGTKSNIADEITALMADKSFDEDEILAAVNMLLIEKWGYSVVSYNITSVVSDALPLVQEVARWKAVDLVLGYHHPDLGFIVVNPKNPGSASVISGFRKNELMVVYALGSGTTESSRKNAEEAITLLIKLVEGSSITASRALLNGPFMFKPPKKIQPKKAQAPKSRSVTSRSAASPVYQSAPVAAPQATESAVKAPPPAAPAVPGPAKMSSLVSVVVSNELFHNGNVEAWKRIIRSYNAKYPNLQVMVYYDGERIVDINTLFKWGKVKHGSCIQFSVAGENIQDLAKLSRYFRQGASPQFEAFLHGSPDTVMNLF
ncbi:MAG: hypothetical protein JW875_01330 [Spirochaetales bacterium]|nr:hypothetical protein [Spirochaetales bacterium]